MASIESIWNDIDTLVNEKEKENENGNEQCTCYHSNLQIDHKYGTQICLDCGTVILSKIFEGCEWNTYKQDDGSLSNTSQRGDS